MLYLRKNPDVYHACIVHLTLEKFDTTFHSTCDVLRCWHSSSILCMRSPKLTMRLARSNEGQSVTHASSNDNDSSSNTLQIKRQNISHSHFVDDVIRANMMVSKLHHATDARHPVPPKTIIIVVNFALYTKKCEVSEHSLNI